MLRFREAADVRICLIYNPEAGTAERLREFLCHLTSRHRCELRPTSNGYDAYRFAREAVEEGVDRIVVAGGDGTFNQVVNGLAPDLSAVELAALPLGTGNDLARTLGLFSDQLDDAYSIAVGSRVATLDVMRISTNGESTYCVNVANGGLGGEVTHNVTVEDKQRWGPLAYWMQSVSSLIDLETFRIRMRLDEESYETEAYGVVIANGRYIGGGFPIAPKARLDDGMLDVTVFPVLPRIELMAAGLNFMLGRDDRDERVEHFRAHRVEIQSEPKMPFSVDGETTHAFDAVFEIAPEKLRVAVSEHAPGLLEACDGRVVK